MAEAKGKRAIVVTGASTGIGRACVAHAVAQGAHVFAAVRKQADAESLAQDFGDRVTPLIMDVTDEAQIAAAVAKVSDWLAGRTLFGLVNNAGIAVPGPLAHLATDDVRRQFETNLFGLHAVTSAFLPLLGADRARQGAPGRIVMISSVGGTEGAPFVGAYAASKHAVEGYSKSLRRELMLYGVEVVVVAPGAVATPIWDKAETSGLERFDNTPYGPAARRVAAYMLELGRKGLPAAAIARVVWRGLTRPKPPFRITILRNKFADYTLPRLLPGRFVNGLIAKRLGLTTRP
ncbi:MAG: SDR family NAD(P)-dependent oxidoreductase [Hydrogenophilaceae bacterium]|jgi:NAD(P)-dependent dehydrogenase (short-subunit alcohol dehydrogenase family)|nr:SDR family NAD(P)-dependent oxidoreductase [Hydrogenophilaceae bacterium]